MRNRAGVCLFRPRAFAQLLQVEDAIGALRCAAEGGVPDAADLAADPYLEPLRGNPGFEGLLSSLRSSDRGGAPEPEGPRGPAPARKLARPGRGR